MIDSVTKMMQLCNNNVQKLEKVLKLNRKNLRIVNGVLRNSDCVGEKRRLENYLARIKGLNLHIESKIENEKIGYGNSKKRRNSKVRWIEVKSAFVGRVRTGAVVNLDENLVDIRRFFHDASPLIFSRITNILKKMTAIKLNFEMSCEYIIPSTGEVSLKYFNTPNTMILLSTDIQKSIDDLAGIIQTKMEEFAESKSGWSLRKICQLMVAFNKYTPINGRIYIPLPTELKKKGGIINIMNTDRLCFVWSVLASLYPCKDSNYERTDAYPQNYHDILNLRGVQMPVQLSSIPKFEAQNSNISINVFTVNDKTHEIEGPIYHTKNLVVFDNGKFTNFECVDIYGRELWIERFPNRAIRVCEHLRQWCSISKFMVPSSFKLTTIGPKEYCMLKNKFWNGSKKSPTSSLADLQLKLEFHSL
ncbi:hypothetical protein Zmor_014881 [Zophobas morio]|uniref:Uncharacterized protein n=1 Tax=Zophobas morio TaxID=2755281 RepID=A0AA38IL51_9CUCU|nr:hypothetical protein Zmor_014881 [Zophobas morio]